MKNTLTTFATLLLMTVSQLLTAQTTKNMHQFKVKDIDGKEFNLASLKGKKVMIVNTASQCGYTPQYADLEKLYEKYKNKNFVIVGFPSNDFGAQEPGSDSEIKAFCSKNYGVSFPMMSKVTVKGEKQHPLYAWLTQQSQNGKSDAPVKWNFQKYLIDETGNWVAVHPSGTKPDSKEIINWIEGK
jgi:glutathione peroxidase